MWRSWSRAITDGVLEWPWRAATERPDLAGAFAAIDVPISSPMSVSGNGGLHPWPVDTAGRTDSIGWRPNADLLEDTLGELSEMMPDHDLTVSGLGVIDDDDQWRGDLFATWLDHILAARNGGVAIRAVFVEPAIDGYDTRAGRFIDAGAFTRDREPKPSFRWIQAQQ